jgi:hypothetical protein
MRAAARLAYPEPLTFKRDKNHDFRYLVYAGDDHIGFVGKAGDRWHWTDSYMRRSGHRRTRADAAQACRKAYLEVR